MSELDLHADLEPQAFLISFKIILSNAILVASFIHSQFHEFVVSLFSLCGQINYFIVLFSKKQILEVFISSAAFLLTN